MTKRTRAQSLRRAHLTALWSRALGLCLAAALLLPAGGARADARGEASRHYRAGLELLANGQTERAIEEFKAAYAIKPHADALYNIARAYVDLGNIPEALSYFRRYIANDPEDRAQVEQVMARLQQAIKTAPEKKEEQTPAIARTEQKLDQQVATGQLDANQLLARLQELLRSGAQPAPIAKGEQAPAQPLPEKDEFEATEVTALSKATAKDIAAELAGSARTQQSEDVFEEQIVTAGVRATTEEKTPASITVIGEEEIRLSGAVTIPELLRRVPGIDVAEMNPSDVNISFRGFNRRLSNKVLVLVDGRSTYQDFLGVTFWALLNVSMHDISRIEVVRGPGSALYGANAFAGVVNIITKTGDEAGGARAFFQGGTQNTVLSSASVGGHSGKLQYRTSVGYDHADKWTRDQSDFLPAWSPQFSQSSRSRENERADLLLTYDAGKTQVTTAAGFNNFAIEIFPNGAIRTFGNEGQSGFGRVEVSNGYTKVKAFWNSLRMNSGPEYWPDGVNKLNAKIRSDVVDVQAQTGFEFKALGTHNVSIGAGYRYKTVDWGFLLPKPITGSQRYDENHFDVFLQEEWQATKKLSVVLSYRVDRHPLLARYNVTTGGLVQSPRGTVLYSLDRDNTLRLTVGSSFRASTFYEAYAGLVAPVPNSPGVAVGFTGQQNLKPESMLQVELGYRGRVFDRFQPEIVFYGEKVTNLILDSALTPPSIDDPNRAPVDPLRGTGSFIVGYAGFENTSSKFYGVGVEIGGKYTPVDGLDLGLNYSFEKIADCTHACTFTAANTQAGGLLSNTATHKLNALLLWRTRSSFDISFDAHYVSPVTWVENVFDPFNPNAVGGVLFTPYALPAYTLVNGRIGYRVIPNKLDLGVAVYNLLDDEHREHPYGNQIGRRFTVTASGAF